MQNDETKKRRERRQTHQKLKSIRNEMESLQKTSTEQLKRHLELFDDAVIAIIITVMVLEIPLPSAAVAYHDFIGSIFIFFISFFVVANFWYENHQTMSFVRTVNKLYLVLNFLFLANLSLIPLLTKWIIHEHTHLAVAHMGIVYLIVNVIRALMAGVAYKQVFAKDNFSKHFFEWAMRTRLIAIFALNIVLIGVAFKWPNVAMLFYLTLPILSFIVPAREMAEHER